ncbi:hypothetical protein [Brevifollis gellanilyticus]|uniref:Uncharacterized protein n=1 Tax=Brevifollis gellanilyticus TaxID=748831 RepID=A0A512MI66_9BACT|nr:hypothetical protein [Brevifollis gellanilyticus]GEP46419.1 hypothetical protein BGE01nite_57100 [Brevifollis gellanilyticus]
MSAPSLHTIKIIQPSGLNIATVRVSPPRGEPGVPGTNGADGADGEPRTWENLEGRPATFPPASHTHTTSDVTGLTASLAGKADLVGGVIPTAQIPAIAITSYLGSVASQAAMLALSGQTGDWCNRSDTSTAWVITGATPNQLSSWSQISYPASPVTSVNGQSGVIVLSAANVDAVPTSRQILTSGLATGGGSLSSNRTINVPAASAADVIYGNNATMAVTPQGARYAIRNLCSRVTSVSGNVHGFTEPGSSGDPALPPDDILLSIDPMDYSTSGGVVGSRLYLTVNDVVRYFYFAPEIDGENPGGWIDSNPLSSIEDALSALQTAIQAEFGSLTFYQPDSQSLGITSFGSGAAYTWVVSIVAGVIRTSSESSQGENGTEDTPPSGEAREVSLHSIPHNSNARLLRAWVDGTFAGTQARFLLKQNEEDYVLLGGWFSGPGELNLMDAPFAFLELPGGYQLMLVLLSPVMGASIDGHVIISTNS